MKSSLKTHYSASELAKMALPLLPKTRTNIMLRATRESWAFIETKGVGGTRREYTFASLPLAVQTAIKTHVIGHLLETPTTPTAQPLALESQTRLDHLTDSQRAIAEARCALVQEMLNVAQVIGKKNAAEHIAHAAAQRQLPPPLQQLVDRANAKHNEDRAVSSRTLMRWCAEYTATDSPAERLQRLAPRYQAPVLETPWWLGEFLAIWRRPNKPTLSESYRQFLEHYPQNDTPPSVHIVRRLLKKLPPVVLYHGRNTGAALKAKLPFVRRDWGDGFDGLQPCDVWIGDGHGMKCKVINPDTGKPQQLEVTLILDASSRLAVGWSVSLSENVIAVADALRHGMTHYPPPLIYYSDNGAGETGKVLDAPLTGILPRCGIHHETGLPGNPQGRGMIERAWQTITLPLARKYPTYQGSNADRDTLRRVNRDITRALTQQRNASDDVVVRLPHVPDFQTFIDDLTAAIQTYNNSPHRSLQKQKGVHLSPQQYFERYQRPDSAILSPIELRDLFRPTFIRVAQRGEVRLWNNVYFARELMRVDGQEVQVGVDIHDPQTVTIRDMDGRYIVEAEFHGNTASGFAPSLRDKLLEDRVKGQIQRAENKAELARETLRPTLTLQTGEVLPGIRSTDIEGAFERLAVQQQPVATLVPISNASDNTPDFVVPTDPRERMQLHRELSAQHLAGVTLDDRRARWMVSYAKSHEYKVFSAIDNDNERTA